MESLPDLLSRCLTQHQERIEQRRNFLHPDTAAAAIQPMQQPTLNPCSTLRPCCSPILGEFDFTNLNSFRNCNYNNKNNNNSSISFIHITFHLVHHLPFKCFSSWIPLTKCNCITFFSSACCDFVWQCGNTRHLIINIQYK